MLLSRAPNCRVKWGAYCNIENVTGPESKQNDPSSRCKLREWCGAIGYLAPLICAQHNVAHVHGVGLGPERSGDSPATDAVGSKAVASGRNPPPSFCVAAILAAMTTDLRCTENTRDQMFRVWLMALLAHLAARPMAADRGTSAMPRNARWSRLPSPPV